MLSSYQSGLRARVLEVARSRLFILAAFVTACILFRIGDLPLPSAIFATLGVWIAIAVAEYLVIVRTHDSRRLTRLQTAALLADIALVAIVHIETAGGRLVGPVISGIVIIAAMATLPPRRAAVLTVLTIVLYGVVVFATVSGHLSGVAISAVPQPALGFRMALASAGIGSLALLLLASAQSAMVRALQWSEERHRLLLATATDMIYSVDRTGRFRAANHAVYTESGYTPEELLGRHFRSVIHPDDLATTSAQFEAALRGEPRRYEIRYLRRDGSARWLSISNSPIRDRGRVSGTVAIARDVTERREAERRIAAQHRIARILASATSVEEAGPQLLQELCESFGFEAGGLWMAPVREDDASAPLWWQVPGTEPAGSVERRVAALARCQPVAVHVVAAREAAWHPADSDDSTRAGGARHCAIFAFPLVSGGQSHGAVTLLAAGRTTVDAELDRLSVLLGGQIGQAIEREVLQRELAHSQTMQSMGRLVSGVAHELNNPLMAVLAFAEQLLEGRHSAEDREALGVIHQQARRARAIVRDLLTAVRRVDDRPHERTDLRAYLEGLGRTLRPRVEELGVSFRLALDGPLPHPAIDQVGIEQVIANLVINGAQAAGPGGAVTLTARARDGSCELMVEDDGPGISAEHMPRLFEPFFTTKSAGEGTGLGLPVSRGIVERHGGTLTATNRPPALGGGARLIVTLPCDAPGCVQAPETAKESEGTPEAVMASEPAAAPAPASAPTDTSPNAPARPAGSRRRVLVIDDEDVIRHAVRRWFTRRGWDVHEAANGRAALDMLVVREREHMARLEPDVILCDLRMPGMTGMDLHERLRVERPDLMARIIFSTGDVVSPDAAAFLAGTECPVLEKPFELEVLASTVDRVLGVPLGA